MSNMYKGSTFRIEIFFNDLWQEEWLDTKCFFFFLKKGKVVKDRMDAIHVMIKREMKNPVVN